MRSLRHCAPILCLMSACADQDACARRIDAAHRAALRDAADCVWAPEELFEPSCGSTDRRPEATYEGVWCSSVTLTCLRSTAAAEQPCFGTATAVHSPELR